MNDPTVVPWVLCWVGLMLVVTGCVLAIWSVVRERFSVRGERIGLAVLGVGCVLLFGTPLLNGTACLVKAYVDTHTQTYKDPDQ